MKIKDVINSNQKLIPAKYKKELKKELLLLKATRKNFILFKDFSDFSQGGKDTMFMFIEDEKSERTAWEFFTDDWIKAHSGKFVSGTAMRIVQEGPDIIKLIAKGGTKGLIKDDKFVEKLDLFFKDITGQGEKAVVLKAIDDSEDDNKDADPPKDEESQVSGDEKSSEVKFSLIKRNMTKMADAIKKIKAKQKEGQELSKKEEELLSLYSKEEISRQEIVEELFTKWKTEKGWANKEPRDILREYGDNWFKFKDELAYLDKSKNESKEIYEMKLASMEMVLQYRQKFVDDLLKLTIEAVSKEIAETVNPFTAQDIKAVALGSVTPTSDYDITFEIPSHPHLEYKCVKYFNEAFLKKQGVNSGVLFDTNVYTSGFMPTDGGGGLKYKDKVLPTKFTDLTEKEKSLVRTAKVNKHQTQLALSIVSIAQALTPEVWATFEKDTPLIVADYLNKNLKTDSKEHKVKLLKEAVTDVREILKKASDYKRQTDNMLERKKNQLSSSVSDKDHLEAQAKDSLYVEALETVSLQLEALNLNAQALEKATGSEREQLIKDRATLITRFEEVQGKALIYANEAYYSGGAAVHVVKGMQGGGGIELGRQQKMQSLLMNLGYKIQHFEHQYEEHGLGRALVGTSKYGDRVGNIIRAPKEFEEGLAEDLNESIGDLTNPREVLHLESVLIRDFKKDDITYPTPSDKEDAAEKYFKEMGIETLSPEIFLTSFLQMATQSLAPFYLDKYNDNLKEAEEEGISVEEVGFW